MHFMLTGPGKMSVISLIIVRFSKFQLSLKGDNLQNSKFVKCLPRPQQCIIVERLPGCLLAVLPSFRNAIIPLLTLIHFCGVHTDPSVTEYNGNRMREFSKLGYTASKQLGSLQPRENKVFYSTKCFIHSYNQALKIGALLTTMYLTYYKTLSIIFFSIFITNI